VFFAMIILHKLLFHTSSINLRQPFPEIILPLHKVIVIAFCWGRVIYFFSPNLFILTDTAVFNFLHTKDPC